MLLSLDHASYRRVANITKCLRRTIGGQLHLPMNQPSFSGIHHLNLTVTEPERSAAWYTRVLGLQPGWTMDDIDGRGRKVVLLAPQSTLRIVLTQHRANNGLPASEFQTGLDHVAFTVDSRASLDDWVVWLDEANVTHSEIKEGATGWLIILRDPDNVQLELYTSSK
jgi:glyoxylase I family protein